MEEHAMSLTISLDPILVEFTCDPFFSSPTISLDPIPFMIIRKWDTDKI
jgi:hypothetical protein